MNEEYRQIKDCKSYEISNLGNIRNVRRRHKTLKQRLKKDGYYDIRLWYKGRHKSFLIHRLVAVTFLDNPLNKEDINHLDFNRSNNRLENLEWSTTSENVKYSRYHGRWSYA